MSNSNSQNSQKLTEHFFRKEYGRLSVVITRYLGVDQVQTAEDIVQETLLKAVDDWNQNGIPSNPKAWLYTTAKNLTFNILKKKKVERSHQKEIKEHYSDRGSIEFSEEIISDEQLKMMFACCHPSIPENTQIALILKILCGFSITEIAHAFFSNNETINKRLVRGRKQLKEQKNFLNAFSALEERLPIVQKTIYLLFNEGYHPAQKNELIRFDLCLEAIRLTELLIQHNAIQEKSDLYALLSLMCFNASRFKARIDSNGEVVEMEKQDREKWDVSLINKGVENLNFAAQNNKVSKYLILATISANHCIARTFQETNWNQILSLYDDLLVIENSLAVKVNRAVALSKAVGIKDAIRDLEALQNNSGLNNYLYYHATLADLYAKDDDLPKAIQYYQAAIKLTSNKRDVNLLEKKLKEIVPI